MKIVCDNCATKYSIADEKVRGKVFKIRCKKCSHIIVVKGTEGGSAEVGSTSGDAPAAAEPTPEAGSADGWHVVINGEQVGPLQPAEIRAKFAAGEIDSESYAWREGFGDWQRLASIDEFHDLQPASPPDSTRRTDDIFGGEPAAAAPAGGDLFGAPSGDLFAGGSPAAAAPAPSAGGGLFSQGESPAASKRSPTPGFGQPAMTEAPAPVDAKMTGQRNESSVLFSLNNLQALASGGGAKGSAQAAVENRPGFANSQTEGSGLIDIRAMAAATLSSSPQQHDSKSNDIPSFSSAPVFSPIAAPILMPSAPSGPPRWIWPVIALGVAAVASIIVVGVLILNKKPEVAIAPVAPAAPVAVAGGTPGTATPAANPGTTAPGAATPAANPGTTAPPAEAKAEKPVTPSGGHEHGKKAGHAAAAAASPASPSRPTAAEPAPAPAPAKKGKSKDELDDLLNGASPDKPKPARAERAEPSGNDSDLPDQLDKGAIVGGMGKVKARVQGCYEQFKVPGTAMVAVTIGRNGHVSNASVSGAFSGTPTGDCVSKAVKGATFGQFKGQPQTINYPYVLR